MHMGTILQIPQAGLTATEEKLKKNRREVIEMLKPHRRTQLHLSATRQRGRDHRQMDSAQPPASDKILRLAKGHLIPERHSHRRAEQCVHCDADGDGKSECGACRSVDIRFQYSCRGGSRAGRFQIITSSQLRTVRTIGSRIAASGGGAPICMLSIRC
jgi:hypothetical protein